jgi:hypothetical protein
VDGVEFLDVQIERIDFDQAAARDAQPVQAAHVAMAEDADFGPVRVVSCSACAEVEVARVGEVEAVDDFQVGEGIQSGGGVGVSAVAGAVRFTRGGPGRDRKTRETRWGLVSGTIHGGWISRSRTG